MPWLDGSMYLLVLGQKRRAISSTSPAVSSTTVIWKVRKHSAHAGHDSNDSSKPCSSTDHDRNRAHARSEKLFAADVHAPNILLENDTATCDFAN
jgi:hypothetical protein